VLCVDNEPAILDGLSALLGRWGCVTVQGANQAEIIAAATTHAARPVIALVDFHLGSENGLDVIEALRQIYGRDLRACLVTADRSPELAQQARRRDIDLLNKPVKPAALRAIINDAVQPGLAAE
jgi:CheY-like chemotaxis protein